MSLYRGVWEEVWNKMASEYFVPSVGAGPGWIVRRLMNKAERLRRSVRVEEVSTASGRYKPGLPGSLALQSGTGSGIVFDQHVWSIAQRALLSWGRSGRKWSGVGCDLWVMTEDPRGGLLPATFSAHIYTSSSRYTVQSYGNSRLTVQALSHCRPVCEHYSFIFSKSHKPWRLMIICSVQFVHKIRTVSVFKKCICEVCL